jgi:hypothetical protein
MFRPAVQIMVVVRQGTESERVGDLLDFGTTTRYTYSPRLLPDIFLNAVQK